MERVKARQRLGKYRIEGALGHGAFADVYRARDEIEGVRVAIKVLRDSLPADEPPADLLREVRIAARLEHPHILSVKNAEVIDGRFVIAYRIGRETLAERLQRRLATSTALEYAEQLLEALAFAHANRVIHCDVKPENLIIMPGGELRLTDFGIARAAHRTLKDGSGSGTVGYFAPEQAFGKPSFRSDVFSAGLVIYRMLAGKLPEWPFAWPPPRYERLRQQVAPGTVEVLRRATEVDARKRFADAGAMLRELKRAAPKRSRATRRTKRTRPTTTWRHKREREYRRAFGAQLPREADCPGCGGPLSAPMCACPWCGREQERFRGTVAFPEACEKCGRGRKLDWRFCPWCWGAGFARVDIRAYTDRRYSARCSHRDCSRRDLMPFMRYCPWCHRKVTKRWRLDGSRDRCGRCGWGVTREFWRYCPWCTRTLER